MKCWYPSTKLQGIKYQKIVILRCIICNNIGLLMFFSLMFQTIAKKPDIIMLSDSMWMSINFLAAKFKSFEGLLSDAVRKICISIEDFEQVHCYCELTSNLHAPKCQTCICIYHILRKMSGTEYLRMCSYLLQVYVIPCVSSLSCVFPGLNLFEKAKLLLNFFMSQHNYVIRGS